MKKTKEIDKDDLCYVEEVEENGLCDFVAGTPVAQFTFENNTFPSDEPMLKDLPIEDPGKASLNPTYTHDLLDNRVLKSNPNGVTPPIDGEYFLIKRGFAFRESTVRKLNQLKATHPDINVYLNTIIDEAICHHYDSVFKEKDL